VTVDLVYPWRGRDSEELLYSIRSARNIGYENVWVVGPRRPEGLPGALHLAVSEGPRKFSNLPRAILAAASEPEVSDTFVLMNDDFFVLEPHPDGLPTLHRGRTAEQRRTGPYGRGYEETDKVLERMGVGDPLSYELHVPMVVDKAAMRSALEEGLRLHRGGCLHSRTLYGNYAGIAGVQAKDVKVYSPRDTVPAGPFVSTNAQSWSGKAGRAIREMFPTPSKEET
jgi:hypothetical protein